MKLTRFLVVCSVGMSAALSQALQVSYTDTVLDSSGSLSTGFSVTQFNPALGTLTGVHLSVNSGSLISFDLLNEGAADIWRVFLGQGATITLNDGVVTAANAIDFSQNYNVPADASIIAQPNVLSSFLREYGYQAEFVGNGTLAMTLDFAGTWLNEGLLFNEPGDTMTRLGTVRTTEWTVIYDYVPEPCSASMLALGLAVIGLRRRFKKTV